MLRLQWDLDCEITEPIESELLIQAKVSIISNHSNDNSIPAKI